VHIDTERAGKQLVNRRLAYVAVSRGRFDAQIYTNDKTRLPAVIDREVVRQSAVQVESGKGAGLPATGRAQAQIDRGV
jgi:ATP-dependent exoDNAse (exonuclease V) alpha subunit